MVVENLVGYYNGKKCSPTVKKYQLKMENKDMPPVIHATITTAFMFEFKGHARMQECPHAKEIEKNIFVKYLYIQLCFK